MDTQFQQSRMQTQVSQPNVANGVAEPKQGGWVKWLLIIMAILVVAAGFFYWIFG